MTTGLDADFAALLLSAIGALAGTTVLAIIWPPRRKPALKVTINDVGIPGIVTEAPVGQRAYTVGGTNCTGTRKR